ncbi:MAG: haloacid dehalogenase-like hydrolase [Lentimicrobium sp.]|nr:haloacid dehalogenase-like hydrolase [Lentimicrobium sp.]
MSEKLIKIAIAYDFDGTLAPGNMQEHTFLPSLKIPAKEFWKHANQIARENDMDEILAYMQLSLDEARRRDLPIRKSDFEHYGRGITFFKGVETYFDRINAFAHERGVELEHYIISSGLREFISGTTIARHFKNIYASGYRYDANGVAVWPALAINYTNKTQYLFRINKGINNSYDNTLINKYLPEEERAVPFKQMIYIGDGETDVPAMKMIKYQGGIAIAVYNAGIKPEKGKISPRESCENLIKQNRANHLAPADYAEGSELDRLIKLVIEKIRAEVELKDYAG